MSKLLRFYSDGNIYFLTIVTYQRRKILSVHFELLWSCLQQMLVKHRAELIAWVLLPDHLHIILAPDGNDPSDIIHDLKLSFGSKYRKRENLTSGKLWQDRFWDHIIRDQHDLNNHVDYIHYNPVKHAFVKDPQAWKYSSFLEFRRREYYQDDWGLHDQIEFVGEYGE